MSTAARELLGIRRSTVPHSKPFVGGYPLDWTPIRVRRREDLKNVALACTPSRETQTGTAEPKSLEVSLTSAVYSEDMHTRDSSQGVHHTWRRYLCLSTSIARRDFLRLPPALRAIWYAKNAGGCTDCLPSSTPVYTPPVLSRRRHRGSQVSPTPAFTNCQHPTEETLQEAYLRQDPRWASPPAPCQLGLGQRSGTPGCSDRSSQAP